MRTRYKGPRRFELREAEPSEHLDLKAEAQGWAPGLMFNAGGGDRTRRRSLACRSIPALSDRALGRGSRLARAEPILSLRAHLSPLADQVHPQRRVNPDNRRRYACPESGTARSIEVTVGIQADTLALKWVTKPRDNLSASGFRHLQNQTFDIPNARQKSEWGGVSAASVRVAYRTVAARSGAG